ncbi:MAG: hypothetical protein ACMG57_00115 [Candidatus Dojkabacteria bacterium]
MNRKIISSTLVVVSLLAAVGGSAFALFRDTEYIPGNTISTGALDISLTGEDAQLPNPIKADGLLPGEWSDWSKVNVTNNSSTDVDVFFYVTNVEGAACHDTNLEFATAESEEGTALFNANIYDVKGVNNKVEIVDPSLVMNATAAFKVRAGLAADAEVHGPSESCSWTGVFMAEPSMDIPVPPVSTPVSEPVSMPEVVVL